MIEELQKPVKKAINEANGYADTQLEIISTRKALKEKEKEYKEKAEEAHQKYREYLIIFNRLIFLTGEHTHIGRLEL